MRNKLFVSFRWLVSSGTSHGGCAAHRPLPLPNQRSPRWYCGAHLSHSASASPLPANAPRGHAPVTVCGFPPSPRALAPCPVAFFRLAGALHARFVPLEATVLEQRRLPWIADGFAFSHFLVMRLAGVGAAQVT